ncbi:metalloregulator ArsR/SmtB family transcription factor [Haloarcula sp. S1CR25-12]|uniref:Metalloregulator ArsR/SmtB family transcription factor n=1 Tax=Haloarcula saliterrae TaxID=2950534 RepID=A0ABU2FEL5_9EURY|nr:metalloregulator ArsR/SmtB family transcription factor [Haloarcula sp. S1CR25-12]MDS0260166.1 metalloregulator ArsR/SmtB family transcription factor [Haloarcula sp. S1CR25-12]
MASNQRTDGRACCEPLAHDVDDERLAADVGLLSGAANDTRYELLLLLSAADGAVCACELPDAVGLSQSAVSHALSTLFDAGLVTREKDGRWRYYDLTPAAASLLNTLDTLHTDD